VKRRNQELKEPCAKSSPVPKWRKGGRRGGGNGGGAHLQRGNQKREQGRGTPVGPRRERGRRERGEGAESWALRYKTTKPETPPDNRGSSKWGGVLRAENWPPGLPLERGNGVDLYASTTMGRTKSPSNDTQGEKAGDALTLCIPYVVGKKPRSEKKTRKRKNWSNEKKNQNRTL